MDKKILIAYFSWGGNTRAVAEKIQEEIGGELFQIETTTPYPTNYHEATIVAKNEIGTGILVPLKENKDVSDYDIVFVGTPVWWYTMAPALKTFITSNDFEGKQIMPFITHGGGGAYKIKDEIKEFTKDAHVLAPLIVYNQGDERTEEEIAAWVKQIL